MVSKTSFGFVALSLLASSQQVLGRVRWLERDNKAILLHPRRFGQEHPAVIDKLSAACPGQVCGTLSGAAITPLLAAQGECTQQDMADQIIDAAAQFDAATQANMIALAIEYRQVEKNTPPDFTTNPPANRNSVFCQKAPKNAQLNGLVQAQDPANGPDLFFDPATQSSVKLGSQANTFPFGTNGAAVDAGGDAASAVASSAVASETAAASDVASAAPSATEVLALEPCTTVVTVTVTGAAEATATASDAVTVSVGASATASSAAAAASSTATDIGNFGSCSVPQIEFAAGFDGRKETSFEPVDKTSFNHGSAQAIGIIAQFICDTLTNSCGADATAKATCATAQSAVNGATAKTGGQADLFNAAFGITTSFADVPAVDDQGNFVPGTGSADAITGAVADFGSCTTPQIEFGAGFDNRKETSFEPVDKTSFNHGSAQAIGIIAQFICDTLTNSCGANAAAKSTCATAQTAVNGAAAKTGGQADLFNAAFGITTNFAAVAAIDDQGNVIAGTGSGDAAASTGNATTGNADATTGGDATTGATTGATGGIGDFGSCSVPQIEFAAGFDNRKETSFQPVDLQSYNHGSAQAIGIIAQFICDTLVNSCGADATAKATCATAEAAVNNAPAKTGGQADAFNAVFGITTAFADVTAIDNQGNPVAGTGSGADAGTGAAATTAAATTATAAASSAAAPAATSAAASTSGNLQAFTGALGATAPAVTDIGGGEFQVDGNSSFKNLQNALVRSCDVQHNQCANAANASGNQGDLTVAACGDQQSQCNSQAQQ